MPVGFTDWLAESVDRIDRWGSRGVLQSLYYVYVGLLMSISKHVALGTNIYDHEWDVLVILDACRVDALRTVAEEYDFVGSVDSLWSVGSTSFEWMVLTFRDEYIDRIGETAYITGNPYPTRVFERRYPPPVRTAIPFGPTEYDVVYQTDFAYLDEVVRYGVDEEKRAVPARTITDRAIEVARTMEPEKLIVHYMQPHVPYLGETTVNPPEFERYMEGEVSRDEMWQAYLDNLRYVLDDVRLLLENVAADRVVITADHGEAFGEWGFYDHTIGCPHPVVRKVPWVETTASDDGTHEPSVNRANGTIDINDHLRDLGYL